MNPKRILQATIFIVLHGLTSVLLASVFTPAWLVYCGVAGTAFGTLILVVFFSDEQSAKLFFFENWGELEGARGSAFGLVFITIAIIWLLPGLCFLVTLIWVLVRR